MTSEKIHKSHWNGLPAEKQPFAILKETDPERLLAIQRRAASVSLARYDNHRARLVIARAVLAEKRAKAKADALAAAESLAGAE